MVKITLDAGHGYNTAGKRVPDGSMREWEYNNEVTNRMSNMLLNEYDQVQVLLTHDTSGKHDVSLAQRCQKANAWGADVFVSVHANAYGSGGFNSAMGIETFTSLSKPKVAVQLAEKVQKKLLSATGLHNRGVKHVDFYLLKHTDMTAILVECGFMTNKDEAALLKTTAYRDICAHAIVNGLAAQYNLKKKTGNDNASVPKPPEKDSADGKLERGEIGPNVQILNNMLYQLGHTQADNKDKEIFDGYTLNALHAFLERADLSKQDFYTSKIGEIMKRYIEEDKGSQLLNERHGQLWG